MVRFRINLCGGSGGITLLARWTSDYGNDNWGEWYHCIKDTPFELSQLKSKQRYEINKGRKYFNVANIHPQDYIDEIYNVQVEAFRVYPNAYRPKVDYDNLKREICNEWNDKIVFAAFEKTTNCMASYCIFEMKTNYIAWPVLKSIPYYERYNVNAAIIAASLEYFNEDLRKGIYMHDGEKNISHQTNFQNYLEHLFGFKRVYCKLNVVYRPGIGQIVALLYPFRNKLKKIHTKIFHNINAVLLMEEIIRKQKTDEHIIQTDLSKTE